MDNIITTSGSNSTSVAMLVGVVASGASVQVSKAIPHDSLLLIGILAVIGLIVGLGHALSSRTPLPARRVVGKTLISMAVSLAAAAIYYFKPDTDPLVIIGGGAVLSVLGAGWLEEFVRSKTGTKQDGST